MPLRMLQEFDAETFACDPPNPGDLARRLPAGVRGPTPRHRHRTPPWVTTLTEVGLEEVRTAGHIVTTTPGDAWHTAPPGLTLAARPIKL